MSFAATIVTRLVTSRLCAIGRNVPNSKWKKISPLVQTFKNSLAGKYENMLHVLSAVETTTVLRASLVDLLPFVTF
jgi:hypothetical protein